MGKVMRAASGLVGRGLVVGHYTADTNNPGRETVSWQLDTEGRCAPELPIETALAVMRNPQGLGTLCVRSDEMADALESLMPKESWTRLQVPDSTYFKRRSSV